MKLIWTISIISVSAPKFKRQFDERGNACPRLAWRASAMTEESPAIVQ
jgi:hypothetical protein